MSKGVQLTDGMLLAQRQLLVNNVPIDATGGLGFAVAGTAAVLAGGGLSLTTGGAANDEATITSEGKLFKFAKGASAMLRMIVDFTEAATDDAELFVGISSGAVADQLQDGSAGPPADWDGFGFFKVGGSTLWSVEAANGTTHSTKELDSSVSLTRGAQTAGGKKQVLGVDFISKTATKADVIFTIDEVAVAKFTDFDCTTLADGSLMAVIKGSSANAEVLNVYAVQFAQAIV